MNRHRKKGVAGSLAQGQAQALHHMVTGRDPLQENRIRPILVPNNRHDLAVAALARANQTQASRAVIVQPAQNLMLKSVVVRLVQVAADRMVVVQLADVLAVIGRRAAKDRPVLGRGGAKGRRV